MDISVDEQIAEAMASWHTNNPKQYLYEDVMKIVEAAIARAVQEDRERIESVLANLDPHTWRCNRDLWWGMVDAIGARQRPEADKDHPRNKSMWEQGWRPGDPV